LQCASTPIRYIDFGEMKECPSDALGGSRADQAVAGTRMHPETLRPRAEAAMVDAATA
jgi:hypothetical protein